MPDVTFCLGRQTKDAVRSGRTYHGALFVQVQHTQFSGQLITFMLRFAKDRTWTVHVENVFVLPELATERREYARCDVRSHVASDLNLIPGLKVAIMNAANVIAIPTAVTGHPDERDSSLRSE